MRRSSTQLDILVAAALSLGGALARLPYLALIPVFEDEVMQTVYALDIRPGEFMPLVGDDPYAGPFFSYLIALSMRLFGSTPVTPRVVVMLMGALTVGVTYLLARALGLRWPWAALAGLLMAANPHHILVNSHSAGATYTLPLFSTAFLLTLVLAVRRGSGRWLVVAGALLGLTLQANPVLLLMLPGVAVWFLIQHQPVIGQRTRWPYLALVALLLVYAPVIIYNMQTGLQGAVVVGTRQMYVWQPNPSALAYVQNLWRLALQLCRQVSGVLEGDETLKSLMGLPLLFTVWGIAGLVYVVRRGSSLPALAVGSQALIMPWLSNHYGMTGTTRYTNYLTPLILVAMSALAEGIGDWVCVRLRCPIIARSMAWLASALLVVISLWPLASLFRYYEHRVAAGETNAPLFVFADEFSKQWRGEKIFISNSQSWFSTAEYYLAIKDVPYTLMPPGRIMEQLATGQETGRVTLILYDDDLSRVQMQADLIPWPSPAMEASRKMGYGVYTIADARTVRKPTFVLTDNIPLPSTLRAMQGSFADQLDLIGYEIKSEKPVPGADVVVNVYWKATGVMPEAYTGFMHLIGLDGRMVAQDDHELGRGFYRTIFWQPNEVIRERYVLTLPRSAPGGDYTLWAGVYRFPSLERLAVRSANPLTIQNDEVMLGVVHVGP